MYTFNFTFTTKRRLFVKLKIFLPSSNFCGEIFRDWKCFCWIVFSYHFSTGRGEREVSKKLEFLDRSINSYPLRKMGTSTKKVGELLWKKNRILQSSLLKLLPWVIMKNCPNWMISWFPKMRSVLHFTSWNTSPPGIK